MEQKNTGTSSGLENILLQEKTSQINKNTSERLIFAKGCNTCGVFTPAKNLGEYTDARVFRNENRPITVRFSVMTESAGVKGMAIKFHTENGDWDLVCSSMPIFALEDGKKFPEYLQGLKNRQDSSQEWEFYGQNPETLHHLLMAKSSRAFPASFSQMHAYSGNIYSFINGGGAKNWVRFHFKTEQGIKNLKENHSEEISDFYCKQLQEELNSAQKPKWKMMMQMMSEDEAKEQQTNPFDATKVWFHDNFPLIEIGEIELESIIEDERETENMVFAPSNIIDGIGFSPDRLLLSRLAVYGDAQRKRLGENYPAKTDFTAFEKAIKSLEGADGEYSHYEFSDPYMQAGLFYTKALQNDEERAVLVNNIIASMQNIKSENRNDIINRQLCHFFRANVELGIKVAMGMNINIDANMMMHAK